MIKNIWEVYYKRSGSRALHRFIYQFQLFAKKETQDDLLNGFESNDAIEQNVFDFIQEQRRLYTESTVMQKVTALEIFYRLHDVPFLTQRIIDCFPNWPIYNDEFRIDLIK